MNAMDNETNKNIHGKQSMNYCVNQSEASARNNAAVNSLRSTKSDDLGEKNVATKCLTHLDFDMALCCLDCQIFFCDKCIKDIWFADINSHSAHRVYDFKTTCNVIKYGMQRRNVNAKKGKQEWLKIKEGTCNKIRIDA